MPRVLVMISGGGGTLATLAEAIAQGRLHAHIAGVVASRACPGVERARSLGINAEVIEGELSAQRLEALVREHGVALVVLAGYLRKVPVPASLAGRVVNIHPALLPRHGGRGMFGRRVHEAVIAAGDEESGCTVHLCDAAYDTGPIVLQKRCPVNIGDTAESLEARVKALEREAYPEAIELLLRRLA
jgi:phosphoribosylglycinamide formyltransferase-1